MATTSSVKGRRKTGGFTLFEMLIAVAVFAVMGVVAFGGLGQMTRTGEAVADANVRLSDLQFAVSYITRDWAQISPRKIRNEFGDEESNLVIEDGIITLTRSGWDNLLMRKRSNLQRVQYLVVDEQLVRRYWLSLDQGIGEKPIQAVLLNDVESVEFEFLDAENRPIQTWPLQTSSQSATPLVLSMRLELTDIGEITRLLEIPDGAL